jgi:mannose-1-phosphate guanylyltransferase
MSRTKLKAVIMAGGSGTRFWPLSRRKKPKQFLPIISRKTMLEETVKRIQPLIPAGDIFTVANPEQTKSIQNILPGLPKENLLAEPLGKNTAPSLILATAWLFLQDPETVVAALPADHLITDPALFRRKLKAGAAAVANGDNLVTFGIPPTFPATGYGYIHFDREKTRKVLGDTFFAVREFKEKPNAKLARLFLKEGNHYWNSGMFLWRAEVFAAKLKTFAPAFFPYWEETLDALKKRKKQALVSVFEKMPSLSIDYALMEKAEGVLVCEGNFGWSDVGAWSSLAGIWPRDEKGNAAQGEIVVLDSEGCLVYNPGKLTSLIGVEDLIIVNTEDALLVCHKNLDQKVRNIIELIRNRGKTEYL